MDLSFRKISDFDRGILYRLLVDAYSFDCQWKACFEKDWLEFDNFFFDNLNIADKYGFITTLDDKPIGHISWDPRNCPEYVIIGHNCIAAEYKGNGYGQKQLREALSRIQQYKDLQKIIVSTNSNLTAARCNYERAGFELRQIKENKGESSFSGNHLEYEMIL